MKAFGSSLAALSRSPCSSARVGLVASHGQRLQNVASSSGRRSESRRDVPRQPSASRLLSTSATRRSDHHAEQATQHLSLLRHIVKHPTDGKRVRVACFARSVRKHRNVTFLAVTDGSLDGNATVQAVIGPELKQAVDHQLSSGAALELCGTLRTSKGRSQAVEFAVDDIQVTGASDSALYPLRLAESASQSDAGQAANTLSSESLPDRMRRNAHLRSRDARHAAILRARDAMDGAMATYFRSLDFVRVVTPILTASDCEGGGEVFQVQSASDLQNDPQSNGERSFWSDSKAYLTVSAQLHLEAITLGLGRAYTVGPSFRAEGSATNRHLAEFWMCEGEQITSNDSDAAMDEVTGVVEGLVRRTMDELLINQDEQSQYLWTDNESEREKQVEWAHGARWGRITYTQAIEQLEEAWQAQELTVKPPAWGESLSSEHERYLARHGPIFVMHYPAAEKPFYMRVNDDGRTVACFDLLVPRIGELVGGSLRETRADILSERIAATMQGMSGKTTERLGWYVDDLRRFGCNPHGGFGLGVERLLSWLTNTDSVRDVVTFPRVKGPLQF